MSEHAERRSLLEEPVGLAPQHGMEGVAVGSAAAVDETHEQRLLRMLADSSRAEGRKQARRVAWFGGGVLGVLAIGLGVYALLPRSVPDYAADPMDEVLDYTLLSDDFNNLPVEKRLALLKDLVARFQTMSGDDSMLMAMFAASIRDEMRRQLEENAKRLAVDVADMYAQEYEGVPPDEAPRFLDEKVLEFTRMMEDMGGVEPGKGGLPENDGDRLAALKQQAQRDQKTARENAPKQMNAERVIDFVGFLQRDASQTSSPAQRSRVTKFMRDMTRHLRGQDVATGKPASPTGPGGSGG